jgi:hypothetical protein
MPLIAFPSQTLTPEDEAVIVARVQRDGHYRCRRELDATGGAAIALLNGERQERGRVVKRHGVYAVLDARGHAVLRTRRLDEVLRALTK